MGNDGAVSLLSGGMDSTVLAYNLYNEGVRPLHLMSVNYGQRHMKELSFAVRTAEKLGAKHVIVDLSAVQSLLWGSALTTGAIAVPDGHYTADSMRITVVPNRNMIMLAIAAGYAVSQGLGLVCTAVHAGDHAVYPDCRPEFIRVLRRAIFLGTAGFGEPELQAPFVHYSKAAIAKIGDRLKVPWEDTWSCYKGERVHCGTCGTCVERREAFALVGVKDPTPYLVVNEITSLPGLPPAVERRG